MYFEPQEYKALQAEALKQHMSPKAWILKLIMDHLSPETKTFLGMGFGASEVSGQVARMKKEGILKEA